MKNIKVYLESSTIHGLTYISTTGRYARVLWTLVIIAGFTGAGVLIYKSFDSWAENPVTTTTETLPISSTARTGVSIY